jgi:hypothetical protein
MSNACNHKLHPSSSLQRHQGCSLMMLLQLSALTHLQRLLSMRSKGRPLVLYAARPLSTLHCSSSSTDTTAPLLLALFAAHITLQNWLVVRCSSSRAHGSSAKSCTGKQQFVTLMYLYTDTASAENDAKHTLISHAAAAADVFNW